MRNSALRAAHLLTLVLTGVLSLHCWSEVAASDTDVVLIEEYWELHIGGPDATRAAPQVTMVMSPQESLSGDFFAFTVNHWSYPDFASGGYQLQHWHGESCQNALHGWKTSTLDEDGETISWVQRLSLSDGHLKFQVLNGQGATWGSFGGTGFALSLPTQLERLNSYRPGTSLSQSGIGYAGNRVSSLTLTKLRWITADSEEHEMVAPIDIDADLDP